MAASKKGTASEAVVTDNAAAITEADVVTATEAPAEAPKTTRTRKKKAAKVAFIGDLHFYDGQSISHKDYYANCVDCMARYTAEFAKSKPDYIVISGDLVGLSERVMRERSGLIQLINILGKWNTMTKGNVYCVRGNHDIPKAERVSDFDVLCAAGVIKHVNELDVMGLRVHCVDYGDEHRELNIKPDMCNVAVTHANLQIEGITTWFRAGDGILLSSLKNFRNIDLVLGGHIHDPSPRVHSTSIDDWTVSLLYLGCATRPKKRDTWGNVYVVYATCEATGEVAFEHSQIALKDWKEIFTEAAVTSETTEELSPVAETGVPTIDLNLLTEILSNIQPAMMGSEQAYREQIKRLAGADKAAAELAIHYIDLADEHAGLVQKNA